MNKIKCLMICVFAVMCFCADVKAEEVVSESAVVSAEPVAIDESRIALVGPVRYKNADALCKKKGYRGLITFEEAGCEWTDEEVLAGFCRIRELGWIYIEGLSGSFVIATELHYSEENSTYHAVCVKK